MKNYRFKLQRYKGRPTRFKCPGCGTNNSFTRYVDVETGECVDESVGKCNREQRCGYHYTPTQFFKDNGLVIRKFYNQSLKPVLSAAHCNSIFIPLELMKSTQTDFEQNAFVRFLYRLFGLERTEQLVKKYCIGTWHNSFRKETGQWRGATVFWFINRRGFVKAGQIKMFDEKGKTIKYINKEGDKKNCVDWIHSALKNYLKKNTEQIPQWLNEYSEQENIVTCLFGEHLLLLEENQNKPIALVEAPKTAIIASVYLPEFLWLAVGSFSYLTSERCKVLKTRKVCLFPDLGCLQEWKEKIAQLSAIAHFTISELIEKKATNYEMQQGFDIADYLITQQPPKVF